MLTHEINGSLIFSIILLLVLGNLGCLVFSHNFKSQKTLVRITLGLSIAVFLVLCMRFYKYTVDDAYISLRYARNLADGYGLVYSTDGSEPVEGYTNFLWIILQTPLFLLKLSDNAILHSIKLLGMVFGVGIIILTYLLTCFITQSKRTGLLAGFFVGIIPYLSFWAIGGLETTMYIFWLILGIYAYVKEDKKEKMHTMSMFFLALAAMTRPEGLFFTFAIIAADIGYCIPDFLRKKTHTITRSIWLVIPGLIIFAFVFGSYFMWRYNFYGYLLPNTFYAKSGSLTITHILNRLDELKKPFTKYLLPIIFFAIIEVAKLVKNPQKDRFLLAVSLTVLFVFSFAAKREWMPGFRYELPFIPLVVCFCAIAMNRIILGIQEKACFNWQLYGARFFIVFLIAIFTLYPAVKLCKNTHYTDILNRAHIPLGKWLYRYAPPESSYASWDMGVVPYYSQLPRIIELSLEGILSNHITHDGYDVDHLLSLNPSFIVLPPKPETYTGRGMYLIYFRDKFKQNYELLFSLPFLKDCFLCVYKKREICISPLALEEGKRWAKKILRQIELETSND